MRVMKPLVLALLGSLTVPGPAGIGVCEQFCDLSQGNMNKPLFILNEAPGTDQTVPPKSSLVNQEVYWGHLQEHAGGVPCGSMGALKPDASLKSPPNWHEARKDEPQEPQVVICRQIHRGAPPARLLVAAFVTLDWGLVSPITF